MLFPEWARPSNSNEMRTAPGKNGAPSLILVLCLLPLAIVAAAQEKPAVSGAAVSWEQASSLVRKIEAIEKRSKNAKAPPGTISVTQGELNSYLNLSLGSQMPAGVSEVEFLLDRDHIAAKATVDLDRMKAQLPPQGAFSPLSLLGGRLPVELKGRFPTANGFGTFEVAEMRLGPVALPVSVLDQIVSAATRTPGNPRGFDILSPFRLPYSLKRVRVQPGGLLLEF